MFKEFREFIARGNVMDMAVGIIMGAAFTAIVNSMVADLINPFIGLATSGVDFANQYIALNGENYLSLKEAQDAGAPVVTYGVFINAVINFFIISFVVFMLVKGVNRIKRIAEEEKKAAAPATPPKQEVLLEEIRDLLAKK